MINALSKGGSVNLLLLCLLTGFRIGPSLGALLPVQEEGDPWRTSFVFGVKARYATLPLDVEGELQFTELGIDPDSSRGYDYSMVLLSAGVSRQMAGLRWGLGGALYPIEARREIDQEMDAVWNGTFPGMYIQIGRDLLLPIGLADLSAKFNIIDFDGLWVGVTASLLL